MWHGREGLDSACSCAMVATKWRSHNALAVTSGIGTGVSKGRKAEQQSGSAQADCKTWFQVCGFRFHSSLLPG